MSPKAQHLAIRQVRGWTLLNKDEESGRVTNRRLILDYTTDVEGAATLCDFLAERGWNCELNCGTNKAWECVFFRKATVETHPDNRGERARFDPPCTEEHYHPSDTMAGAICGAFLRTLHLWTE